MSRKVHHLPLRAPLHLALRGVACGAAQGTSEEVRLHDTTTRNRTHCLRVVRTLAQICVRSAEDVALLCGHRELPEAWREDMLKRVEVLREYGGVV